MDKKGWFTDARIRLAATAVGAVSAIIAAGVIFDWRAALAIFAAEVVICLAYSLQKLIQKKREAQDGS